MAAFFMATTGRPTAPCGGAAEMKSVRKCEFVVVVGAPAAAPRPRTHEQATLAGAGAQRRTAARVCNE